MPDFSKNLSDNFKAFGSYGSAAVQALREKIRDERSAFVPSAQSPVCLRPDRSRASRELSEQLCQRLSEMGLTPQDVLVRFVDGQAFVHSPTARTIGENSFLAMQLGVSEINSTWASPFYSGCLHIGADHPTSGNRAYIVYRAADLICIDHVGDRRVDRPFYVFKGNPHAAVLMKIYDGASLPLDEPMQVLSVLAEAKKSVPTF